MNVGNVPQEGASAPRDGQGAGVYAQVMHVIQQRNVRVETMLEKLDEVHRSTADTDLRIFLSDVRSVLSSKLLEKMRVTLPLDRAPYQALAAYCQRQVKQG